MGASLSSAALCGPRGKIAFADVEGGVGLGFITVESPRSSRVSRVICVDDLMMSATPLLTEAPKTSPVSHASLSDPLEDPLLRSLSRTLSYESFVKDRDEIPEAVVPEPVTPSSSTPSPSPRADIDC